MRVVSLNYYKVFIALMLRTTLALVAVAVTVHATGNLQSINLTSIALAAKKKKQPAVYIDDNISKLPIQVAEMHEAILDAARRGNIEELLEPIQMNELKPDFGNIKASNPIEEWKKLSIDGEGREILAILNNILQSPYTVVRQGRDIENNKLYIWPFFTELPINKLPPHLETQLLRLIPRQEYQIMKKTGKYTFWQLTIGADGTWHSFKRIE